MGIQINIIQPRQFAEYSAQIGAKSRNLRILQSLGYNVPDFVAIPSSVCEQFINQHGEINNKKLDEIAKEIINKLPEKLFAVRSSALVEDSETTSLAGQFHTVINVQTNGLSEAIKEVITQAYKFLNGDLNQFSILVQKYIKADYSGVVFTRAPEGGRELVINYHKGIGEDLVSGKVQPLELGFYHNEKILITELPLLADNISQFIKLEEIFKSPQDIEWCMENGQLFFLQSRPITTINANQYKQCLYLDKSLPKTKNFLYEKSEISEIAPTPSPFCWSLLRGIYADKGPVANVYKKFGVDYTSNDFLIRIGNELFVDRENEIKTLLPSFGYLSKKDYKIHFAGFKGIFKTLKNFIALNKIKLNHEEYFSQLKQKLCAPFMCNEGFPAILESFYKDYELIFTINLLADKAIEFVATAMAKEPVGMAEILASKLPFEKDEEDEIPIPDNRVIKGNALEISDESPFIASEKQRNNNEIINKWWKSLSQWKQTYYTQTLTPALKFLKMREYGRWLTVRKISELRESLVKEAEHFDFINKDEIYFTEIEEIINGKIDAKLCQEREKGFLQNSVYRFPVRLTGQYIAIKSQIKGVSAGVAEGYLKTINDTDLKDNILYTELLTPDLTKYFGNITGIVSENGGMLSHLAIMAREQNIPVVVGFNPAKNGIQPGDKIKIDGNAGTVQKLPL